MAAAFVDSLKSLALDAGLFRIPGALSPAWRSGVVAPATIPVGFNLWTSVCRLASGEGSRSKFHR